MSKHCPNCGTLHDSEDTWYCEQCGPKVRRFGISEHIDENGTLSRRPTLDTTRGEWEATFQK